MALIENKRKLLYRDRVKGYHCSTRTAIPSIQQAKVIYLNFEQFCRFGQKRLRRDEFTFQLQHPYTQLVKGQELINYVQSDIACLPDGANIGDPPCAQLFISLTWLRML